MPGQDTDRFRKIRDQQLHARDPLKKQHRLDQEISRKRRRMQGSFSLVRMWTDLPHKWRGGFIGSLIGLGVLIAAPAMLEGFWGLCIGGAALPFAALVGFLVGRYQDTLDEIRDHLH